VGFPEQFDSGPAERQRLVKVLRLFTFGGLGLESDEPETVPRLRSSRLAVLAVLAAAGSRGIARERLAALFWPDSDEEHSRHSLRQMLYGLRQDLDCEVIASSGSQLSLDARAMSSDIGDFYAALAAGDREGAVALMRGPFLDAFYLQGAPAFERWIDDERQRLHSAVTSALLSLASDATRTNQLDASVTWWRRLTQLDPLSGRFALGYLKALASRGDRAEALAFARQHEAIMRRELDTDPDPDVRRVEAELRAMPSLPFTIGAAERAPSVADRNASAGATTVNVAPSMTGVREPRGRRAGPRTVLLLVSVVAALTLVVSVSVAFARSRGWLNHDAGAEPTFAVGLIREAGIPDSLHAGPIITDMLATNLARVEGLRVLANSRLLELMGPEPGSAVAYTSAARRAGASEVLEGQLTVSPAGAWTLELQRVELRSGIVKGVYRVGAPDRFQLVDSVTAQIARGLELSTPAGSVAGATTTSPLAYRLYEEGLRAYHQSDHKAAQRLMRAALEEDSTFAMAAWYEAELASAAEVTPDGRPVAQVRQTALRLASRAPERERLTITANILSAEQDPRSLAVAESLTTRYPDDPGALRTLGRVRMAKGDWPGAARAIERAIVLDSVAEIAGSARCRVCAHYSQLIELYFWWDSLGAAERTARRFLGAQPTASEAIRALAIARARMGDSTGAYAYFRQLSSLGAIDRAWKLHLDLTLGEYDVLERDVRQLLASSSMTDWGNGAWLFLIALRNQGRLDEAMRFNATGSLPGLPSPAVDRAPSALNAPILAFERGEPREAARLFRGVWSGDTLRRSSGVMARRMAWTGTLTGMALAAAGDTAGVRALADSVQRWGAGSAFGRDHVTHHYLRGLVHSAGGRHEEALRAFRAAVYSPALGFTRVNFEMARTLLQLNRPAEAVSILQAALRGEIDASNLYVTRTELHELLAESFSRAGQADSAAAHYRAVVKAWQRADPAFHARRDRAAAALARLTVENGR
jgi:DNA-binding SARP family transcriptional activator